MLNKPCVPLLGFAANSGTGKTSLLIKLLPLFKAHGLRVGMIKHAHHSFDIDHPGKDSYELRKAGAARMLVVSKQRWALMVENDPHEEPRFDDVLAHLDQHELDLILVEGFKHETFAKIELHRSDLNQPLLFSADATIVAIATDIDVPGAEHLMQLDINNANAIFDFIIEFFGIQLR